MYVTNINPKSKNLPKPGTDNYESQGHLLAGYFFPYPESKWGRRGEGYVSTISDDPPQLNWIFVDRNTYEVKYGLRVEAEGHHVGPWNVSPIDRRLTFDGWEGFIVVEEDVDGSGEEGKVRDFILGELQERKRLVHLIIIFKKSY